MYAERVSIVRPTLIDSPYSSQPVEDWDNPVLVPLEAPVSVHPLTSEEDYDGRGSTVTVTGWRLISAPGYLLEDLDQSDRIVVDGWPETFAVDGRPAHWRTILPHTEARLQLYEGMGRP